MRTYLSLTVLQIPFQDVKEQLTVLKLANIMWLFSSPSFKFNTGTQRPYKLQLFGKTGGPYRKSSGKELEGLVNDKVR